MVHFGHPCRSAGAIHRTTRTLATAAVPGQSGRSRACRPSMSANVRSTKMASRGNPVGTSAEHKEHDMEQDHSDSQLSGEEIRRRLISALQTVHITADAELR